MADAVSRSDLPPAAPPPARSALGARIRDLRVSRGLSQSGLAGDRFSKEYVSQIERGKTRPNGDTLAWIARRLGVDPGFLETGVPAGERERVESALARAEAAIEASRFEEAIGEITRTAEALERISSARLDLRARLAEAWARMYIGEPNRALELLATTREIVEAPEFTDADRAEVLYRLGCCRFKMNSISTATALLSEAYELAARSELPVDRLRAHILGWRSRCHQRHRDWVAAREDVERALELAERLNDRRTAAHTYFQASLVAERTGHWVLARTYAAQAKAQYEEIADRVNVGKLLNNLGGLSFLLGKPEEAIESLKEAFRVALEVDNEVDAGYAVSSLAQVHQRIGEHVLAEEQARRALVLLGGREDHLDEIGNAQLVLGRALLAQDRLDEADDALRLAEESFSQISSASHAAAAWLAQGDVATRRGDDRAAAHLYRRAAEALQDFRF